MGPVPARTMLQTMKATLFATTILYRAGRPSQPDLPSCTATSTAAPVSTSPSTPAAAPSVPFSLASASAVPVLLLGALPFVDKLLLLLLLRASADCWAEVRSTPSALELPSGAAEAPPLRSPGSSQSLSLWAPLPLF